LLRVFTEPLEITKKKWNNQIKQCGQKSLK